MKKLVLQQRFEDFIATEGLIKKDGTVLLAVSGGVDSMVMLHLFQHSDFDFQVAHCNFSLRGKESEKDEQMLEQYVEERNITFHKIRFNTEKFAKENKLSIQLAARELRYNWFRKIMQEETIGKLATAHHLDDSIETFLINLNRGTGIAGLSGIPFQQENIIRPLIRFSKKEIIDFAHEQQIPFREDQSNKDSKYLRNWFRNQLLPLWESRNPNFRKVMQANLEILSRQSMLLDKLMDQELKIIKEGMAKGKISIANIKELSSPAVMLYNLFHPLGFSFSDLEQLVLLLNKPNSGKKIQSGQYNIHIDRKHVFIHKIEEKAENKEYVIASPNSIDKLPIMLQINCMDRGHLFKIDPSEKVLQADAEKIRFPLKLRKWKDGDIFQPLGMKGRKKISDFLIDIKVPLSAKNEVYVLLSEDEIICLLGYRLSEKVKIDKQTTKIMEFDISGD